MELFESQRGEINRALAGDEQLRRDQLLLHEQLSEQNKDLRETHEKSLYEMEEIEDSSRFYVRYNSRKGDRELVLVHRTRRDRVSVAFLVQAPCGLSDRLSEASCDRR